MSVTAVAPSEAALRFAYADPPYPGKAKKHYGPNAVEVNFPVLIGTLTERYDGWALSCNSTNLRDLLPLCPDDVRVMSWVKRFATWKKGVNPAYAWEPVIVKRGRKLPGPEGGAGMMLRDWIDCGNVQGTGFVGAKPLAFCRWVFMAMGAQPDDELDDLFPGTGAVGRAWDNYQRQGRLAV